MWPSSKIYGTKVRTGPLADGAPSVLLANGAPFILTTDAVSGTAARVGVSYAGLATTWKRASTSISPTARSRCASNRSMGTMSTRASKAAAHCGRCKDQLPDGTLALDAVTIATSNISPSVSTPTSTGSPSRSSAAPPIFLRVRAFMDERGQTRPIMAKIEKHEALEDIDAIVLAADGIMVARGDLGVEILLEEVR